VAALCAGCASGSSGGAGQASGDANPKDFAIAIWTGAIGAIDENNLNNTDEQKYSYTLYLTSETGKLDQVKSVEPIVSDNAKGRIITAAAPQLNANGDNIAVQGSIIFDAKGLTKEQIVQELSPFITAAKIILDDGSEYTVLNTAAATQNDVSSNPASSPATIPPTITAGHPSDTVTTLSAGGAGMYLFYCFDGSIYKIAGDDNEMAYVYDESEVSKDPIGNVYNPLYPDAADMNAVYRVNGMPDAAGTSAPQRIAIEISIPENVYERADFVTKGDFTFNGRTYQIAPVTIGGDLTTEKMTPYEVDKKIGQTADGFDVYSYKNPPNPDALAVDIPGMTCDLGEMKLYPMAKGVRGDV